MARPDREKLKDRVEVDETFLGAEEAGIRERGTLKKASIVIAVEQAGDLLIADEIHNARLQTTCCILGSLLFSRRSKDRGVPRVFTWR